MRPNSQWLSLPVVPAGAEHGPANNLENIARTHGEGEGFLRCQRHNEMTQRDKMRQLFQLHGEKGMEEILRQYAKAEASGEVRRKKKGILTTEEYAVMLYKDGIKKGWIRQSDMDSGMKRNKNE